MQLPIRLYNTLSRKIEELKPLEAGSVKLYCCGPTVYDYQHIGNLRTYLMEDILVRTLEYAGYKVKHVMNITDVGHLVSDADQGEDKMLVASRRENKKSEEIAQFYTDIFFADCAKLNIRRPQIVCKATEHINEMIELIKRLGARGITYVAGGNVYFDVSKFGEYGKLAGLDLEKLKAGARIEIDQNKKNPQDFVLWFTKSKFENQELQWESPWGRGYPGWHIECSAMAMKYLGEAFDIHCGGIDHVPVHHTNEIAQSEGATGKPWVNIWMHGEFLVQSKDDQLVKMSKSKGGFLTVASLLDNNVDPMAFRFFCLGTHYRKQLAFSWEALRGAQSSLESLKTSVLNLKSQVTGEIEKKDFNNEFSNKFNEAMFNDLNFPNALATVWNLISAKEIIPQDKLAQLYYFDQILGLNMKSWAEVKLEIPNQVQNLIQERELARQNKQWQRSDELKQEILSLGYIIEDGKSGTKVKKI